MTETGAAAKVEFPIPRTCPYHPAEEFTRLREEGLTKVGLYNGTDAWLVTRHADAKTLLTENKLSSDRSRPDFPLINAAAELGRTFKTLISMDPPEHNVLRKMLLPDFTAARMRAMRPVIEETANALIDVLDEGEHPFDFVRGYAAPLAGRAISQLIGVPYEQHDFFERRVEKLVFADGPEQAGEALGELLGYLTEHVTEKQKNPGNDMVSRLATEYVSKGQLEESDLISATLLVLGAGHPTTAATISIGLFTLFEHPDQLDIVRNDPDAIPGLVEELLRFLSVADIAPNRVALEDVEIDGRTIRAGEGVIFSLAAANRDATVFPEPDKLDVRRPGRQHLAFGFGLHQCLGHNMGRMVIDVAFRTLLSRKPNIRLAVPASEITQPEGSYLPDIPRLPVTW